MWRQRAIRSDLYPDQSQSVFLYDLSDNHALIPAGTTDADSNFNGPAFVVTNYSPEDRIEMVANENYFVPDQPSLAGLDIIFFNDDTAVIEMLRGGQIDLAMRMSTALFESLKKNRASSSKRRSTNGFDLYSIALDRAPGDDPQVMQALKLATDRGGDATPAARIWRSRQ